MRASLSLLLLANSVSAEWRLADSKAVSQSILGAAIAADRLYTWGRELRRWNLSTLQSTVLARFQTGEGGCLVDIDRDGRIDLVAPTSRGLAWFRAPLFAPQVIDSGAVTWDCSSADLHGHWGVVVVHRGMQVRLYEFIEERWTYHEIYSFYTASEQAGLLWRDIDADGRPDLVCGNYWIQSPPAFDLPWRLFAINTLNDRPRSASARLTFLGPKLVWAESRESPARLALFTPPRDPKLIWTMELLASDLRNPQGLATDGSQILVAENAGPASRLWPWGQSALRTGWPTILLHVAEDSLFQIGPRGVRKYVRNHDRTTATDLTQPQASSDTRSVGRSRKSAAGALR